MTCNGGVDYPFEPLVYSAGFLIQPEAFRRGMTAGSRGRWVLIASPMTGLADSTALLICEVCHEQVSARDAFAQGVIRCRCDTAANEAGWRAWFGDLTELPAEAWGEPA